MIDKKKWMGIATLKWEMNCGYREGVGLETVAWECLRATVGVVFKK